jgi:UrcA family protein
VVATETPVEILQRRRSRNVAIVVDDIRRPPPTGDSTMTTATLTLALALGAFAAMTSNVQAAQLDQVQYDPPNIKVIGHDPATYAPVEDVTVIAHVIPDPDTLTTDSGVVLLNDYIREAARKACFEANPLEFDDGTCFRKAMKSARPQVKALVARVKAEKAAG